MMAMNLQVYIWILMFLDNHAGDEMEKQNIKKIILVTIISLLTAFIVFAVILYYNESNKYEFTGQSSQGAISLSDLKGKNVVIYFGYTYCPDVCPITLETLNKAMENLKQYNISAKDLLLLYVTLDPARDTPEALDEYATWFYPNGMGIRFDEAYLQKVAAAYNIKYEIFPMEGSAVDYSVAHSSALFFFNKDGKLVDRITNLTVENVMNSIKKVMDIK